MRYRVLGKTGLSISEIGYGGEHITEADFKTTEAVLSRALEKGVNIFDVFMPQPNVRENMGKALRPHRKEVILQGHIGAVMNGGQYERSRDVGRCEVFVRDFLEKFHTDYIDLGMMHFIDTEEDFHQAFDSDYVDYVCKLKRDGIIRFIGVSSHNAETAKRLVETGVPDMLMFSVNPAFDLLPAETAIDDLFEDKTYAESRFQIDPKRAELYRLCEEKGVGITNMKTLGGGRLLSAEASPFGVALTPLQCIRYALDRPAVKSVLMGARSIAELDACLAYEAASEEDCDYTVIAAGTRSAMQGKCVYCNHCLPCPQSIDIAAVTKFLDMASQYSAVPDTVAEHYAALPVHGGDCIACGACEPNCPFSVAIRDNMKRAAQVFGY